MRKFRDKYNHIIDKKGNKVKLDPPLIPQDLKFYALKHSGSFYAREDGERAYQLYNFDFDMSWKAPPKDILIN